MINRLPFLKSLVSAAGISGFESPICKLVSDAWRPLVDELDTSRLGSLHGLCVGVDPQPRHRLMLSAHMDAVGLMVTGMVDGLLRITDIGGIDARVLPGQPVTIHARQDLPAIVVQPPVGLLPPDYSNRPAEMEYLWVDTGLLPPQVAELVRVGDPISFAQPPIELTDDTLCGHSLDNRASLAALTICLDELQGRPHGWDVWAVASVQEETGVRGAYTCVAILVEMLHQLDHTPHQIFAVFSSQEEVGLRGAIPAAYGIDPDLGLAIDVTAVGDTPKGIKMGVSLGKGPAIKVRDAGFISDPCLVRWMVAVAEKEGIPYQLEVLERGNRWAIHPAHTVWCSHRDAIYSMPVYPFSFGDGRLQ